VGLCDAKATAGGPGTVGVDALPSAGCLILKALAARWRLGGRTRTFPIRLRAVQDALQARRMPWWERASVPLAGLAGVAPQTSAEWTWPGWVPAGVREQVEAFRAGNCGRGPRTWLSGIRQQQAPEFGAVVTPGNGLAVNPPPVTGCYIHAWHNIGRLVLAGGSVVCPSINPSQPDGTGYG
jgi:hypothetical protein